LSPPHAGEIAAANVEAAPARHGSRRPIPKSHARVVAIPIAFNEEDKIGQVIERFSETRGIDVAVVDDGSTDRTGAVIRESGAVLIRRERRGGAGAAIRTAYGWARERGYHVCVILSGNDKDRPSEMPRLVEPILRGEADLVQGSRYAHGGEHVHMPLHRRVLSQAVHARLLSFAAGQRMTDTTNGFRALRLSILDDPRLLLDQRWLDGYELEPYLLLRAIRLGYAVREAPVTKVYPGTPRAYSKMRGVKDWWGIVRPVVFIGLGLAE
jgi:dolichol-phosphate mannosyltransferase